MSESAPKNEGVRSVKTAFAIIETVKATDGIGITAIADELGIAKSTVYNHLTTLEKCGYVVRVDDTYELGLQFLDLGYHARSRHRLYDVAKPEIDSFVSQIGDRCQLMVREGTKGIYIYQASGNQAISTDSHIGTQVDLHATAVGKVYLAHLSDTELEALLNQVKLTAVTDNTITDRSALEENFEQIREQGYALNDEERILGMRAVGAPIQSEDETVLGALSVSGPTTRLNGERYRSELPEALLQIARVIGIRATYP